MLKRRQGKLDDAGIELTDERADAGRSNDEPWIA
jgi:hypothetical protein